MVAHIARAALFTLMVLFAPRARADVAAILNASTSTGADRAERIVADLLEAEGVDVLTSREVTARLEGDRCSELACAIRARQRVEADWVMLLAAGRDSVEITLVEGDVVCGATEGVVDGGFEAAALEAFRAARRKQRAGRGPWVSLEGEPEGALVVVDGTEVGVTPYFGAIVPGRHRVDVRLDGFEPETRVIEIGMDDQREHTYRVDLAPGSSASPRPTRVREPDASGWNYVIGAALVAAAGAAAVGPIRTALADDTCMPDLQAQCSVPTFGAQSIALSVLSGVALVSGAVFLLATPIDAEISTEGASVRVRGVF